jgi:hypothetical protein
LEDDSHDCPKDPAEQHDNSNLDDDSKPAYGKYAKIKEAGGDLCEREAERVDDQIHE